MKHAGTFAEHFSANKLQNRLEKEVFWLLRGINKWTRGCRRCFVHNPKLQQHFPCETNHNSETVWVIGVDVLERGIERNRYAVTAIGRFFDIRGSIRSFRQNAQTIARVLFLRWVAEVIWWPKTIFSDEGGEFETRVMSGTIAALPRRSAVKPINWDVRLPFCMMAYIMTPHSATGGRHILSCREWTPTSLLQ